MQAVRVFVRTCLFLTLSLALSAAAAHAQQTGTIQGRVIDNTGAVLPGVTVEAKSSVLPTPHTTVSGPDGVYQLPALPPGIYTVTFTLSGFQTASLQGEVQLASVTALDAKLSVQGVSESVQVTAESGYVDRSSAAITSGLNNSEISRLPVGTQYRDLINLIPGVMYTQDQVRGPSAGASGQDNVYNFDGVNVTLPLFGTLSAEPSSQDIAQFTVVKGGAQAIDFNRAGGFNIDSVSKSGTNRFSGQLDYRFQRSGMTAKQDNGSASRYDENRDFLSLSAGGPVLPSKVFFYGSYYRPTANRRNAANVYGDLPNYDSVRNEGFAKVTAAPSSSILVNGSYRDSHRVDTGSQFGAATASTAGTGNESWQKIGTVDGSWILKANAFLTFKYTHFENPTRGRPDYVSSTVPNLAVGTHLDVAGLDKQGLFTVPKIGSNADVNAFIQPLINQYGYIDPNTGARVGGGTVGYGSTFDNDNFFRDAGQIAFNYTASTATVRHNFHVGYQQYVDSEDLYRTSNGWGAISVPAGTINLNGTPIFYQAQILSQGLGTLPKIHSEYRSKSIEANDTVNWNDWTLNVGLVASNDDLYGQGLQNDSSTLSGFVKATGATSESRRYLMKDIPFTQMFQPRLSTTWAYNHKDTVYVSYARYNPSASSLPRAASWDRNLAAIQNVDFDANGNLFAVDTVASSTGKLFAPGLTPRRYDEWLAGTSKQFTATFTGRAYFRYRRGSHYWEDTNNNARLAFNPPTGPLPGTDTSVPRTYYIGNLAEQLTQIGTGGSQNSYVIAELDGAFTDYREATFEGEYRKNKLWAQGSMTFSRYYGNFDQDASTTTTSNDSNIFIGSSNIGDGAGRQMWDNKLGRLRGDRPFAMKLFGTYQLDWHASLGVFYVAQSGQPWETHSYLPYASLTTSVSNTDRYSEPAGSHRSPFHTQLDLNYTQDLPFLERYRAGVVFYVYNLFNKQTGYDVDPNFNSATYSQPVSFYLPRRLEMTVRLVF